MLKMNKSGDGEKGVTKKVALFGLKESGKTWLLKIGVPFAAYIGDSKGPWRIISKADSSSAREALSEAITVYRERVAPYRPTDISAYESDCPVYLLERPNRGISVVLEAADFAGEFADNDGSELSEKAFHHLLQCDGIVWCLDVLEGKNDTSSSFYDERKIQEATDSVRYVLDQLLRISQCKRLSIPIAFCLTKIDFICIAALPKRENVWEETAELILRDKLSEVRGLVQLFCPTSRFFCVSSCGYIEDEDRFVSNYQEGVFVKKPQPAGINNMISWLVHKMVENR